MTQTTYPHIVVATITESLGPLERGRKYGDPLDAALRRANVGEVCGAGTQLDAERGVSFIDLEVALANTEGALELLRTTLKSLGAPNGSVLTFMRDGEAAVVAVDSGAQASPPEAPMSALERRMLDGEGDAPPAPYYDESVVRATAEQLLASYRSLFVESYPVGRIFPEAYDRDVFAWYDATGDELASLGFTALGDLKNVKDARRPEPGAGPFARRFLSDDHSHRVDIFQMQSPADGAWTRVINVVTELSDGAFLWTSTAPRRWNTPDHILLDTRPSDTAPSALAMAHLARVAAYRAAHAGATPTAMATLDDVLASENRCQAKTAAFRRTQGVPSVDELVRLGAEPTLAERAHRLMHEMVFGAGDAVAAPADLVAGQWQVVTVELPWKGMGTMSFQGLIDFALEQGMTQVEDAGSPLNPFLIHDSGRTHFFVPLAGDGDPMEIALRTLRAEGGRSNACALVIDSRITFTDGRKCDAIVVMASRRDASLGETWAQGYRPKGFLRSFKRLELRERVATSKNLFVEAGVDGL